MATDKFVTKENLEDTLKALGEKNFSDFSTAETRVGTWIDGKPLYRKVFTGSSSTYSESGLRRTFSISLNNTSNMIILKAGGMVVGTQANGTSVYTPLFTKRNLSAPEPNTGYTWGSSLQQVAAGEWLCVFAYQKNDTTWTAASFEIWIEYTKTTD